MKHLYTIIVNILLFFFITVFFANILTVGNNELTDKLFVGLLFGILMAAAPFILQFMKVKENPGALILIGVVVTFIFYFIGYYALDLFILRGGRVELNLTTSFLVEDRTFALIVISLFSSVLSVILEVLKKQK